MKLYFRALLLVIPIALVTSAKYETESVCRDYLVKNFPNGTSCVSGNLPTFEDLVSANIEMSTAEFLEQHCCAFGGGDRISHDNLVFEQLRKFTRMSVSDFQDKHSPSQKALFWLVKEDSYPNLEDYFHIGQRFSLSSIYFGLNGDTGWLECSDQANTNCTVPNNKTAWMSGVQECEWAYLSCNRNLFVTEIIMPSNVATTGDNVPIISSDIGLLGDSLEKIDLRNNRIGSTIPTSIGNLILLTSFDVGYNNLQGGLSGILLTNATGLEVLRVDHNSLTGTIPDLPYSQLRELNLSFNNFTGTIPNLSLSQLRDLNLSFNNFTGNFTNVLADIPTLGIFPIDVCNRNIKRAYSIEEPTGTLRLECPLNCDSVLENVTTDSDSSNECGGFGSGLCSDYIGWLSSWGGRCDWYERNDDPGCPVYGDAWANEYGIFANDACCYCGGGECTSTCFNTTDKGCTNDDEWSAIVDNDTVSCDWFERNDEPGCLNTYSQFLSMENVPDPRDSCCYCSNYCFQDLYGWQDARWDSDLYGFDDDDFDGYGCWWYEKWDEPGCPLYGDLWPDDDGITAREACCHCRGYNSTSPPACYDYNAWVDIDGYGCDWYEVNDDPGCPIHGDRYPNEDNITANAACCYCGGGESNKVPSASPSHQYKPTITPSTTPTYKSSHQHEPTFTPSVTLTNKPSHQYEPTVTPTVTCYDYIGWVDKYGITCELYEAIDDPGCPIHGDGYPNEDGITANDACCYCVGGESMKVPSASPSNPYQPTVTPTVTCIDYIGWVDTDGLGCYEYEYWDDPGCPWLGDCCPNEDGITAKDACCYCGRGFDLYKDHDISNQCHDNDDHWQNIAHTKYLPGNHQSCEELEYYISILNNQQTYNEVDWTQFYCNELHNGTVFMYNACCICNPDRNNLSAHDDELNDRDDSSCVNHDIQIPKPWPQRNCEWFARNVSRCEEFGNSTVLIEGDNNVPVRYANDVCCVCGGGTRECREFNDDWMDSHPDEPFNCSQYESEERCAADGSGLVSLGHNANTQCCICGGGFSFKSNDVIVNATDQTCLDETDWKSNDFACSSFFDEFGTPDVEQCLALGHITSVHGVNASEGCCGCWYGYDAETGGGYQGMLLGKMLRIGMMNYTDLEYVHNVTSSGDVEEDSTIYGFVRNAAESYGFGLIHYDMNELNKARGLYRMSNDTYYACLDALSLSLVDVCIGPYKNSSFPPGTKSIKGLYREEYILVVREYQLGLRQYVLLPFAPFDYEAWLLVTMTLLFLTFMHRWFALGFLRSRQSESSDNLQDEVPPKSSIVTRFQYFIKKGVSVFFYFFTSFSTGVVDTEIEDNDSTPASNIYVEKIIVVALSVFLFFTLLFYGGSTAAEFVNSPQGPEFQTIYDVFSAENKKVCFHDSLFGIMEREYPTDVDNFHNSTANDAERLLNLQNNDECDGLVISRYSLSFISTQIESSCDNLYPLYDENLFTQEVIIAISQTLGEFGDELVNIMDIMASKNLYRESHDNIVSNLSEGCEFKALNDRNGVAWESFFLPLVFSAALAVIAFIIGCMKHKKQRELMQSESNSPQCNTGVEFEGELALLLNDGDDLYKFSSEVKRLNEESEERIMERIIDSVESRIMRRITADNERAIKQIMYGNESLLKHITNDVMKRIADDTESMVTRITDDNESMVNRIADIEGVMNRITEYIERNARQAKENE